MVVWWSHFYCFLHSTAAKQKWPILAIIRQTFFSKLKFDISNYFFASILSYFGVCQLYNIFGADLMKKEQRKSYLIGVRTVLYPMYQAGLEAQVQPVECKMIKWGHPFSSPSYRAWYCISFCLFNLSLSLRTQNVEYKTFLRKNKVYLNQLAKFLLP